MNETINPIYTSNTSCTIMKLINLAEPEWLSIPCDQNLLSDVLCQKDRSSQDSLVKIEKQMKNQYKCNLREIKLNNTCFFPFWVNANEQIFRDSVHFVKLETSRSIIFFNYLFSTVNLETDFPPLIFNVSSWHFIRFRKYYHLMTHKKIQIKNKLMQGFEIYISKMEKISKDIMIFSCSKGGYIHLYSVCNGVKDCPNDNFDEEVCKCTRLQKFKFCKWVFLKNQLKCSNIFSTTVNGNCEVFSYDITAFQSYISEMKHF